MRTTLEEVWAVAMIAKTCLSAKPSRRLSARPGEPVAHGAPGLLPVQLGAAAVELVAVTWQSLDAVVLDRRHSWRSHGSGGEALFMFSFKGAVAMDVVPKLAATLEEDDILL
jgi:hypothetical protein